MQKVFLYIILQFCAFGAYSQYYFRGRVVDENEKPLISATVQSLASGALVRTGSDGSFGLNSSQAKDSMLVAAEGFVKQVFKFSLSEKITVKLIRSHEIADGERFANLIHNYQYKPFDFYAFGGGTYADLVENPTVIANENANVEISLNMSKASYSNTRRYLSNNLRVPAAAVRPEDYVNYFNPGYKEPPENSTFLVETIVTPCPWKDNDRLLLIKTCTRKVDVKIVPASNFVFLIDVSASMETQDRLPLLKMGLRSFVPVLRDSDRISIITYGGGVKNVLSNAAGSEKESIIALIDSLKAGGFTPGHSGIRMAYEQAKSSYIVNGANRVVLATDGDFNMGQTSTEELENMIASYRSSGISLTCLGVGMGNYRDEKLQSLAKIGSGNFGYIDNLQEAQKILVEEFAQNMYTVAKDAKIRIHLNAEFVHSYKLIGFENKLQCFKSVCHEVIGGEVGGGSSSIMMIQFTPQNLKPTNEAQVLGSYYLNYFDVKQAKFKSHNEFVKNKVLDFSSLEPEYKFSVMATRFALMLRDAGKLQNNDWGEMVQMARAICSKDAAQQEFLKLVEDAENIYDPAGKKKRSKTKAPH